MSDGAIALCAGLGVIGYLFAAIFFFHGEISGDTAVWWPLVVAKGLILSLFRVLTRGWEL